MYTSVSPSTADTEGTNTFEKEPNTDIVDISKLLEGRMLIIKWQDMPIGIYKRTNEDIESIRKSNELVYDPYSRKQSLPKWWQADSANKASINFTSSWINTAIRSKDIKYFVFNMVSPITGCAVTLAPKSLAIKFELNKDWLGGFYDSCSKVKFDYSGRVYTGQSTGRHLFIPPYKFIDEGHIKLHPNG